jgi:hypothetical protein
MSIKFNILDPRTELPPGQYYIGDPCYVIEEWEQALDETRYFNLFVDHTRKVYNEHALQNGVFRYIHNGIDYMFAVSSTMWGDGEYPVVDWRGKTLGYCGVDVGMIGAIPVEMIRHHGLHKHLNLGVIYEFKYPFNIRFDDGTISFSSVFVYTNLREVDVA